MRFLSVILIALSGIETLAWADGPQSILQVLTEQARGVDGGFSASTARGEHFFRAHQTGGETDRCTACHTEDAKAVGQHFRTHKVIEPLAPIANRQRFTDLAHVEKWFKRNCKEVLGRSCTVAEKADFVAYMLSVK